MSYPNPCDTCEKATDCRQGYGCEAWKIRYRFRQKQINAFSKRLMYPKSTEYRTVFRYEHPDIIRRYLQEGPCAGCKAADVCEIPCPAYLRWWDARMEWLKWRLGL